MRAQGERDLDAAAMALASGAAAIDPLWAAFKNQCLGGFTVSAAKAGREWYGLANDSIPTPNDDACRAMFADLTGKARGFLSQLEIVEDAARKADVLPARGARGPRSSQALGRGRTFGERALLPRHEGGPRGCPRGVRDDVGDAGRPQPGSRHEEAGVTS
jgi:hypothetical protein